MTTINEILNSAGVRTALIVDDAFDQTPRAQDITPEIEQWNSLFDDLDQNQKEQLTALFPLYNQMNADDLISSDEFIAAVWENRENLGANINAIFARYELESTTHLQRLNFIKAELDALGLNCQTSGRDFTTHPLIPTVNIIIIDLYLGSAQTEDDINLSIQGLLTVVKTRKSNPPLVILMSSSPHLHTKRAEFRDKTGLFESAFRVTEKSKLDVVTHLHNLLERLASHYKSSTKLANFVDSWERGLESAKNKVTAHIKKLDLVDLAQIQQLLLNEEGEPAGSYLVDIFDKVLQYEVESEMPIIDAAISLNELNLDDYPAPYVPNSTELQSLIFRSLFQHTNRLKVSQTDLGRVFFGDVLRLIPQARRHPLLRDIEPDDIMLVVTPACDLQRIGQGAVKVMFMLGKLKEFNATEWKSWNDNEIRTPVIEMEDSRKFWIKWKPKHIETISAIQLQKMLISEPRRLEVIARLRESHTLELQQKLISNLGRVGLVAPPPAKFPVTVQIYIPASDNTLSLLNIPTLDQAGAVCYVGRAKEKDMCLVISESICEDIFSAVDNFNINNVHADVRETINYLKASLELLSIGKGINLPKPTDTSSYKTIPSSIGTTITVGENTKVRTIGHVRINPNENPPEITNGQRRNSGIVLIVKFPEITYLDS